MKIIILNCVPNISRVTLQRRYASCRFTPRTPERARSKTFGGRMPFYVATTFVLLTVSNVFMTFAWYGHLKYKSTALWSAVLVSWLIAFVEYCFQVPANRIGHNAGVSTAQLKTFQELITLGVFCVFSVLYLKEPLKWNYVCGFVLIGAGALFVFAPWQRALP